MRLLRRLSIAVLLLAALFPAGALRADDAPAAAQQAAEDGFEPIDAYDLDRYSNLGGKIERVAFRDSYTLLVLRVVGVREFVYLPTRPDLDGSGIDTGRLVPGTLVEVDGYPHRHDRHKTWGTDLGFL